MTMISCNCCVSIVKDEQGYSHRQYSIYINNGGPHPSSNEANNLDIEDLKTLERELSKSIHFEKQLNHEH